MPPDDQTESYRDKQARMDRAYEADWRKWFYSLNYSERAALSRQKMDRPWVEKPDFGRAEGRELEDAKTRFEQTAAHEITPADEVSAAEMEREMDGEERAEQGRQKLRNRHFHFFAMFMGTGVEQFALLKLRAIIVLRHAAPRLLTRYGLVNGSVLREMQRLRAMLNAATGQHDYIPLGELLSSAAEDDEEAAAAELCLDVPAFRLLRFGEFCEEIAELSPALDQWVKNCVAWMRRTKPGEIAGLGQSQTANARKFGETRATVSAREIRVVEQPMKAAGVKGYHLLGGTKTDTHRKACAQAQQGNTNRRDAEARKRTASRRGRISSVPSTSTTQRK